MILWFYDSKSAFTEALNCLLEQTWVQARKWVFHKEHKLILTLFIDCDAVSWSQYTFSPLCKSTPHLYEVSGNAVKTKCIIHLDTKSFSAYVDSLSICV